MSELPSVDVIVKPEWIDHNGHMNVAYYVLAFDQATDDFYERLGLGLEYPQTGHSVFTLAMNVDYLQELFEGDRARVQTRLIDADHKRLHYIHTMTRPETEGLIATNECLAMNVDLESRKSAPFPESVTRALASLLVEHQRHPLPAQTARRLEIRRPRPTTLNPGYK